jgi:hypothetical protein
VVSATNLFPNPSADNWKLKQSDCIRRRRAISVGDRKPKVRESNAGKELRIMPILQSKLVAFFCVLALAIVSSGAWAVSPPPDGGYDNANTAEGADALLHLTTGSNNTALGFTALQNNTTGDYNTATGSRALLSNFAGSGNTAHGYNALSSNTTGNANTAAGKDALAANTSGSVNTANGDVALANNSSGSANTANGVNALAVNTIGSNNTADGFGSLMSNTDGNNNIGLGYLAGSNLTDGDNNIDIGNAGVPHESGKIRIGTRGMQSATYIAGIAGSTVSGGAAVYVDNKGHLGTVTSAARYKEAIKPMNGASEAILDLAPVTFRYRKEIDPTRLPQFGLIAEQVAEVAPELVVRDENGKPYTVRYEAVNAMLLNEFLKEHRKVEALEARISRQEKELQQAIKELHGPKKPQ